MDKRIVTISRARLNVDFLAGAYGGGDTVPEPGPGELGWTDKNKGIF